MVRRDAGLRSLETELATPRKSLTGHFSTPNLRTARSRTSRRMSAALTDIPDAEQGPVSNTSIKMATPSMTYTAPQKLLLVPTRRSGGAELDHSLRSRHVSAVRKVGSIPRDLNAKVDLSDKENAPELLEQALSATVELH